MHYYYCTPALVLVDPGFYASPNLPPELVTSGNASFVHAAPLLARLGLMRLAESLGVSITTGDLTSNGTATYRAMHQKTSFWDQMLCMDDAFLETCAELRATNNLGSLPLIVLNPDQPDDTYRRTTCPGRLVSTVKELQQLIRGTPKLQFNPLEAPQSSH